LISDTPQKAQSLARPKADNPIKMALGGFNCPFCNHYNANEDRVCYRCERHLPPPKVAGLMRTLKLATLPATKILAALSIVVFALQIGDAGGLSAAFQGGLMRGMPLSNLMRFGAITTDTAWSEPWRMLAACYVHMGLLHVGMNMWALSDLGRQGEERVGSGLFAASYVVTGIFGFVASNLWYGRDPFITAGASGAVFGLMGVVLGERARRKDPAWKDTLIRAIIASFVYYFALHTNQAAHLGGLVLGLAIGYFATHRLTLRRPASILVLAAAGLALSLVCLVIPHFSPKWRELRQEEHDQYLRQLTGHEDDE
jgi:rhomboid protease GluP